MHAEERERTLFVKNIHSDVTQDLLHELFIQAGPVNYVSVKKQPSHQIAFIEFKHQESVLYTIKLLDGVRLFGKELYMKPRDNTKCFAQYEALETEKRQKLLKEREEAAAAQKRAELERYGNPRDFLPSQVQHARPPPYVSFAMPQNFTPVVPNVPGPAQQVFAVPPPRPDFGHHSNYTNPWNGYQAPPLPNIQYQMEGQSRLYHEGGDRSSHFEHSQSSPALWQGNQPERPRHTKFRDGDYDHESSHRRYEDRLRNDRKFDDRSRSRSSHNRQR